MTQLDITFSAAPTTSGCQGCDVLEPTVVGGGALAHGIAPRYALEALQAVPGDDVSIYGSDPLAPILFAAPGAAPTYAAGTVAVVMPMRR